MLTVASVLRSGGVYTPLWVQRLKDMVARDLSLPHRFVCLSDRTVEGVDTIPLEHGWPRFWSKIELFGPALRDAERVLYLDLDVVTTGSLDALVTCPAPLVFCPPHPVLMGVPAKNRPGLTYKYQTSCMVWSPVAGRLIYEGFKPNLMRQYASDQDWIAEVYPDCPTFPVEWFRKLRQCPEGPPLGVRVVLCMPDKNDVASQKYPWVKEAWLGNLFGPEGGVAHTGH